MQPTTVPSIPLAANSAGAGVSKSETETASKPAPPRRVVEVQPWPDPVMEQSGHDPRSIYVEMFWLPLLGPSTTLLLRRLSDLLDASPDGVTLNCELMSLELGLGGHTGRNSVVMRSIDRTCKFGLAQQALVPRAAIPGAAPAAPTSVDVLFVRRRLPSLSDRQVGRLPVRLQQLHVSWDQRDRPSTDAAQAVDPGQLMRARRLALTLLQLGEDAAATERQLHTWRFHPSVAWSATHWAAQHTRPVDKTA